jgi:histidine triad (HIT) family protein
MTIFARIIRREIPADIVYEDDLVLAFRDIAPVAPVHIVIIPKEPLVNLADAQPQHEQLLGRLFLAAGEIARKLGVAESGYRVVTNSGENAGQSVFHMHLHLIGGRPLRWPPG